VKRRIGCNQPTPSGEPLARANLRVFPRQSLFPPSSTAFRRRGSVERVDLFLKFSTWAGSVLGASPRAEPVPRGRGGLGVFSLATPGKRFFRVPSVSAFSENGGPLYMSRSHRLLFPEKLGVRAKAQRAVSEN